MHICYVHYYLWFKKNFFFLVVNQLSPFYLINKNTWGERVSILCLDRKVMFLGETPKRIPELNYVSDYFIFRMYMDL